MFQTLHMQKHYTMLYINADMVDGQAPIWDYSGWAGWYLIIRRASIVAFWDRVSSWGNLTTNQWRAKTLENGCWGWRRCRMTLRKSSSWQRPGLEYSQVVRINDVSRPNVGFSQLGRLNPIIWWWSYSPCQKWCLIKSDEVPTKVWTWQDELSLSGCNFSK